MTDTKSKNASQLPLEEDEGPAPAPMPAAKETFKTSKKLPALEGETKEQYRARFKLFKAKRSANNKRKRNEKIAAAQAQTDAIKRSKVGPTAEVKAEAERAAAADDAHDHEEDELERGSSDAAKQKHTTTEDKDGYVHDSDSTYFSMDGEGRIVYTVDVTTEDGGTRKKVIKGVDFTGNHLKRITKGVPKLPRPSNPKKGARKQYYLKISETKNEKGESLKRLLVARGKKSDYRMQIATGFFQVSNAAVSLEGQWNPDGPYAEAEKPLQNRRSGAVLQLRAYTQADEEALNNARACFQEMKSDVVDLLVDRGAELGFKSATVDKECEQLEKSKRRELTIAAGKNYTPDLLADIEKKVAEASREHRRQRLRDFVEVPFEPRASGQSILRVAFPNYDNNKTLKQERRLYREQRARDFVRQMCFDTAYQGMPLKDVERLLHAVLCATTCHENRSLRFFPIRRVMVLTPQQVADRRQTWLKEELWKKQIWTDNVGDKSKMPHWLNQKMLLVNWALFNAELSELKADMLMSLVGAVKTYVHTPDGASDSVMQIRLAPNSATVLWKKVRAPPQELGGVDVAKLSKDLDDEAKSDLQLLQQSMSAPKISANLLTALQTAAAEAGNGDLPMLTFGGKESPDSGGAQEVN